MSRPIFAWSYSSLSSFENCPRKLWATKIKKIVSDTNADNTEGNQDHEALQHHFSKGLALPQKLSFMQPLSDRLRAAPGERYVEYSMSLTQQLTPTRWNDWDNVYVRGAADLVIINGEKANYFDWKKGKPNQNEDQIELTSLLLFRHFPQVQQVNGGLVFYNFDKVHPHIVRRADESRLWNNFITRVKEIEQAKINDQWPTNPNPLCGWCSYLDCPFNKQAERLAAEAQGQKWKWRPT